MSEARIRRRAVVHGRVQGVFFRASTCEEAERCGVEGWVRNCPDGSVEAAFEGPVGAVEAMLRFVERGPRWAAVTRLEVFEEPPEGARGFRVR